ncbi:MAG: accessory gene regulator B family protein [Defluviitaleaceae bacterium]|nr:accessory gene regulator B family protein [Defluviitaleaceae bacterium]
MIHTLANRIASIFVLYGESSEEDKDIYVYACEVWLSTIFNIGLSLLIAVLLGRVMEVIIIMTSYALLARYTGGYHANTHFKCILTFAVLLICAMTILSIVSSLQVEGVLLITASIAFIGIFILTPVEHENKPISADLRKLQKIKSRWITFALLVLCIVDFFILDIGFGLSLSLSVFFVFGSMLYATLSKRKF